MLALLRGKKTYLLVATGFGVLGLEALGVISGDARTALLDALGMGALATLRSALARGA